MSEGLISLTRLHNIRANVESWIEILCGWTFRGLYGSVLVTENVVLQPYFVRERMWTISHPFA